MPVPNQILVTDCGCRVCICINGVYRKGNICTDCAAGNHPGSERRQLPPPPSRCNPRTGWHSDPHVGCWLR